MLARSIADGTCIITALLGAKQAKPGHTNTHTHELAEVACSLGPGAMRFDARRPDRSDESALHAS